MMKTGLIVVAGGRGTRMGPGIKKQYIDLCGIPVLVRSLAPFIEMQEFAQIVVIVPKEDIDGVNSLFEHHGIRGVMLATGGATRSESVYNGLTALDGDTAAVVIHDGVRPLVTKRVIKRVLDGVRGIAACCPAVPVKDTIKVASNGGWVEHTPDRAKLWAVQTPQAFDYRVLFEAYERARAGGLNTTDDCSLVEHYGIKTKIVMGDYANIKITTPEDVLVAEALLRNSRED